MYHPGWPFMNRVWSCPSIHPSFSIPHWKRMQNPHHGPQGPAHLSGLTCHYFLLAASKHTVTLSGLLIICKLPSSLCSSFCLGHPSLLLLLAEPQLILQTPVQISLHLDFSDPLRLVSWGLLLSQELAKFFCKGPNCRYVRPCGPDALCPNYSSVPL